MKIDLRELAIRNQGAAAAVPPPRRWASRYLVPGIVVLGFALVLAWSLRAALTPARAVTVLPVLTSRQTAQAEGTPVFQAAGWVEPRPQPVLVTALAEGVVERLHVVENSPVKKDDVIAELTAIDAELAVKAAAAEVRLRKAEVASAKAAHEAAGVNLEKPVHLTTALAEAQAMLAQKQSEKAVLPHQKAAAEARLRFATVIYENQKGAFGSGALPETQLQQAKAEFDAAAALLKEIEAKMARVQAEVDALDQKRAAQALRLELLTEERRAAAETKAALEAVQARLDTAQNALDTATLRLARMKVLAPCSGRVLSLVARPGSRLMGQDPRGMLEASTVVSLYDPKSLQVRADVRLEDAWRVQPGQKVQIIASSVPKAPLDGTVLYMTSQADVQKNTIQVKVSIDNPPDVLRPEMLVQVVFLAPRVEGAVAAEQLRILAPRSLVLDEAGKKSLWVADTTAGVARRRTVALGAVLGDVVEVSAGLQVGDRLIVSGREDLRDGQRITITGEDATLVPAPPHKKHDSK